MPCVSRCIALLFAALLSACSPTFNWRDAAVPEMATKAQFPCKPQRVARDDQGLLQCETAGMRFVLGWRPLPTDHQPPAIALSVALEAMRERLKANEQAWVEMSALPKAPLPEGPLLRRKLQAVSGELVWVQLWLRGGQLQQALVVGRDRVRDQEAALSFFAALQASR